MNPTQQRGQILEWITPLLCAALMLAIVGLLTYQMGHSRGLRQAAAEAQQRERTIANQHQQALADANDRERTTEDQARQQVAAIEAQLRKERDHEQVNRYSFAAAVRAGAVRLSIPTVGGSAHCGADPGADPATAPGDRRETRAELAPEAGLALVAIADDGNDAIRQLNACIDTYNAVRARLNLLPQDTSHAQAP